MKKIILANPRGFCAGVERAIAIVELALKRFGAPVYVRHEVVHNAFVCDNLRQKGAVFVEDLKEVPQGATLIFSAHGVAQSVRKEAQSRGFLILDATCPLVTKVHKEVQKMHQNGKKVVVIGHKGHPEVEGTMGQIEEPMFLVEKTADIEKLPLNENEEVGYVTQTTLSVDESKAQIHALKKRFPKLTPPKKADICFATQNRQDAVKKLAALCEVILVVGSNNSSNSRRLKEVAMMQEKKSFLVENVSFVKEEWLEGVESVGVTAGASAPEILVEEVVLFLEKRFQVRAQNLEGIVEKINFPLPSLLHA